MSRGRPTSFEKDLAGLVDEQANRWQELEAQNKPCSSAFDAMAILHYQLMAYRLKRKAGSALLGVWP
jgi:hypothetical protein